MTRPPPLSVTLISGSCILLTSISMVTPPPPVQPGNHCLCIAYVLQCIHANEGADWWPDHLCVLDFALTAVVLGEVFNIFWVIFNKELNPMRPQWHWFCCKAFCSFLIDIQTCFVHILWYSSLPMRLLTKTLHPCAAAPAPLSNSSKSPYLSQHAVKYSYSYL